MAGVAKVEIQPAIRTKNKRVNTVVMLATADAAEEHFLFVRLVIAVHIGEHLHLVAGADNHLGALAVGRGQHAHAVGGIDVASLIKERLLVCLAVAIGILKDEDAVAFLAAVAVAAVVDNFTHPNAAAVVDVDIRRAEHHRFAGEQLGLQFLVNVQILRGFLGRTAVDIRAAATGNLHKFRLLREHVKLHARLIAAVALIKAATV